MANHQASKVNSKTIRPGIYRAIVKDNVDKMGMGRVKVYIPSMGGDPTDANAWYTASPMAPQAAATNPYLDVKDSKKDVDSQDSYGMWANGYHLENELMITFLNGDPSKPIILGGVFGQNMTNSVAGYPAAKSNQGTTRDVYPPTVEYNKRDDEVNPRDPVRPRRQLTSVQLKKQGLYRDTQRGQMSTSPHRDDVPQFTSMKTPRGNMFVMDDGKMNGQSGAGVNERFYARGQESQAFIRTRSSRGAQIYINDNCGYVYMNTADGNSFMEVSNSGIQMFTAGMMAARAKNSFSLRVDGDYNLEVLGTTNMKGLGAWAVNVDGKINLHDNGAGIAWETPAFYSVGAKGNIEQQAGLTKSTTGETLVISWADGQLHENTMCPPDVPEAAEVTTGDAADREGAGCNGEKEAGSSLPAGSMVTHEPAGTHASACGQSPEPSSANCDPMASQGLSDGSVAEAPAYPPDECGSPEEGEQDYPEEGKSLEERDEAAAREEAGLTEAPASADPSKDVVRVVDAGPGWTEVELADGTIERRQGSRNWRNNNPGNIEYGPYARSQGAVGSDGRFAIFPSYEAGRAAKENLLFNTSGYSGKTIGGAINRYAPPSDGNNTNGYIGAITRGLGVPASTPMSSLSPSQRSRMLDIMQGVEGYKVGKTYR